MKRLKKMGLYSHGRPAYAKVKQQGRPMTEDIVIRDARQSDVPAILSIYNHAVEHTTAIWNETTVDLANRIDWLNARAMRGFPVLVAEAGGKVAGYASYGDWRAFDGYRHTVEHSVYVEKDCRGRGIGALLMASLIDRARAARLHVMIAGIEAGNEASVKLHEKLGFRTVGTFRQVGIKFGAWLDLTCMELRLDDGTEAVLPPSR